MAIFQWMNTHLKNDTGPVKDADDPPLPGKRLRVFPEEKDLPGDATNARIDESFVARGKPAAPAPDDWQRWRADLLAELRPVSFRTFPDRIPAAEPRLWGGLGKDGRWLATEPGIEVAIVDLRRAGRCRQSRNAHRPGRRRDSGVRAGLGRPNRG